MFATFSERAKITMSIERCKISMEATTCQDLIASASKEWKGALALNQSRSSTGAFVSSYVQSILGKARARGATSVYCDAILAMSSWSCMLICCWG